VALTEPEKRRERTRLAEDLVAQQDVLAGLAEKALALGMGGVNYHLKVAFSKVEQAWTVTEKILAREVEPDAAT
jgi:hypothetical protein